MGGLDTEISETTTTIALEMAWFEMVGIGRAVTRNGLRSEASARFERGVDPYGMPNAIARFAELLGETCPHLTVHAGAVDERTDDLPPADRAVDVRVSEVNRILGTQIAADDLPGLLDPIGYTVSGSGDVRTVVLPTWRLDSTAEIDVIEEVARHYGYERIGKTVPKSVVHGGLTVRQHRRRLVRDVLLGLGISEAMPNPFLAPDTLERAGLPSAALTVTNPLVADESVLRTSLRPGLLEAIAYNESHRRTGVRLFEIGHVYPPSETELPAEYEALTVVLAGSERTGGLGDLARAVGCGRPGSSRSTSRSRPPVSTRRARRHCRRAATRSGRSGRSIQRCWTRSTSWSVWRSSKSTSTNCSIVSRSRRSGSRRAGTRRVTWTSPSSCPDDVAAERLDKAIRQGSGKLLVDLTLFDVYRGDRVAEGTRSLAYRLRLQAIDRNLTDADVADVRRGVEAAATKLGAELRS